MNQFIMVFLAMTLLNLPTKHINNQPPVFENENNNWCDANQLTEASHAFDDQISPSSPSVIFENGQLKFYFATGKAEIANKASDRAHEILEAAKQGKRLGIIGHVNYRDEVGTNVKLVKERAQAVRHFLVSSGVPESQIELMKPNHIESENDGRLVTVIVIDDACTQDNYSTVASVPK